jgi:hypothetical protein
MACCPAVSLWGLFSLSGILSSIHIALRVFWTSALYYTLFRHNWLLPLLFWWTYHFDLEFHIGKRCYQALQCFLANYSYHFCCPYRHLSYMIRWIPHCSLPIAGFLDFRSLPHCCHQPWFSLSQMAVSSPCSSRLLFYNVERNLFVRSPHCCSVTIAQPWLTIHNCLSTWVIKESWATLTIHIFNCINASGFSVPPVLFVQVIMFLQHPLPTNPCLILYYGERSHSAEHQDQSELIRRLR